MNKTELKNALQDPKNCEWIEDVDGLIGLCEDAHEYIIELEAQLKSNKDWPDYNLPGQCGLCGSFHCSGGCFK